MNTAEFLDERGIPYEVIPHRKTYDAQHMAQSLHVSGHQVAKTILVRADGENRYLVLVVPATEYIDPQKVSNALGGAKIELATEHEISSLCSGCEFGVVPIFGSQFGMQTMVDRSLAAQDDIYFQGDTHDQTIRMLYGDFCRVERPRVASIIDRNRDAVLVT